MKALQRVIVIAALAACSPSSEPSLPVVFQVERDTVTDFAATVQRDGAWARVVVRYTPQTTYYELTSSFGPLALAGTEVTVNATAGDASTEDRFAALMRDPRASEEGYVTLRAGDREYALLDALMDQLIASGASASPTPTEKATTRYAAAYTCARVLGMLEPAPTFDLDLDHDVLPTIWPYPGYDSSVKMPLALAPAGADPNSSCCGPNNCTRCENYKKGWPCTDWCSAGDHCNAYHQNCGSILTWPGHCPHQDSSAINKAGGAKPYCRKHGY